jgi:hypothetical protein
LLRCSQHVPVPSEATILGDFAHEKDVFINPFTALVTSSLRLQAFVISWTGRHEQALVIHQAIRLYCSRETVVFSDKDEVFVFPGNISAVRRSDTGMFGDKLRACLDIFDGDVFQLIPAHRGCEAWPLRCETVLRDFTFHGCAVWSPNGTNSSLPLENGEILRIPESDLSIVVSIGTVVFAIDEHGLSSPRRGAFDANAYGWWAPVPALADVTLRWKRVVMSR